jgi:hypothetical protein
VKKYNTLLTLLFIGFIGNLMGLEKSEQSFFDEPVQEAFKDTVFLYSLGYTFLHGIATGVGVVLGTAVTDLERYIAKQNKENFAVIKSLQQEIPKMVSFLNKGVIRTHIVAVPLAMGFAHKQYNQYKNIIKRSNNNNFSL